ncbi:MAG: hypothetical protein WCE80_03020 [Acidimicrobiia bacterium]
MRDGAGKNIMPRRWFSILMNKRNVSVVVAAFLLCGCSANAVIGTTTSSSSTQPTTTETPSSATTSTADIDAFAGPDGSGCHWFGGMPHDGMWYGYVKAFDQAGITFDLACFFTGDSAALAATEDGVEWSVPPEYYVRNESPQASVLTVASDTPVRWYVSGALSDHRDGTFREWIEFLETHEPRLGVWVTIEEGAVTSVEEQWTSS